MYATDLNMANMDTLAEAVKATNPACEFVARPLDVSSENETVQLLKEILKTYGRFDFYFANAGFINPM